MPKQPFTRQNFVGDRVALPPSIGLAIIIVLAVFVTMLFTGKMSDEEAELMDKKTVLEEKMKENNQKAEKSDWLE